MLYSSLELFYFGFYWLEYLNKLLDIMKKYATSPAIQLHLLDVYYCVCVLSAFIITMNKRLVSENHHKKIIVNHRPVTVCFKHSIYSITKYIYQRCHLHVHVIKRPCWKQCTCPSSKMSDFLNECINTYIMYSPKSCRKVR